MPGNSPKYPRFTAGLTDTEIVAMLQNEDRWNAARRHIRFACALLNGAQHQRGPIDERRVEFELVKLVVATYLGSDLDSYRHVKRQSEYELLGHAQVQCEEPLLDMDAVVVYRAKKDGSLWVRPPEEFNDGRFEKL